PRQDRRPDPAGAAGDEDDLAGEAVLDHGNCGMRGARGGARTRIGRGRSVRSPSWSLLYSAFRFPHSAIMAAVRIAHFSDVHLTAKPLGFRPRDWMSKRFTGWLNVRVLGRGRSFRHAPAVTAALVRTIKE